MWVITAVEFKRFVTGTGILGIFVYKFSYWQEACQVILYLVYKSFEIDLYCAVMSFGEAICLKIEGCKEFLLDS